MEGASSESGRIMGEKPMTADDVVKHLNEATPLGPLYSAGFNQGRRAGLEEAARIAEDWDGPHDWGQGFCDGIAAAIPPASTRRKEPTMAKSSGKGSGFAVQMNISILHDGKNVYGLGMEVYPFKSEDDATKWGRWLISLIETVEDCEREECLNAEWRDIQPEIGKNPGLDDTKE